ncbi:hypothetical protein ACFRAU_09365 [Arthrobacter sp. NPDC056691]|uniref:hypothetical protein n=1 Tax=Arthrobacter sp. NPDC056691 TaxID=3345913 RepID=UPI00366E4DAB
MAKAWLAAHALGHTYVEMPWALNPRGYRSELGAPRTDWISYTALARFSRPVRVSQQAYVESGIVDYGEFIRDFVSDDGIAHQKSLIHDSGMAGGYAGIVGAREFLWKRLIATEVGMGSVSRINLQRIRYQKITVGVHIRAGDFDDQRPLPGTFNNRIPLDWYTDAVDFLSNTLGDDVHFFFVTEPDALTLVSDWRSRLGVLNSTICCGTATEDLGVLASTDLLICSVSSFSLLAAFLGDSEYMWYADHLTVEDGSAFIWSDAHSVAFSKSRPRNDRYHLGIAGLRGLPFPGAREHRDDTLARLRSNLAARHAESNLIFYGAIDPAHLGERTV